MHRTHGLFRRTSVWVATALIAAAVPIVTNLSVPPPSAAGERTIEVEASADATVFGRIPRDNFGTRDRLVTGARPGGSRTYIRFNIPATDLSITDATLVLHTLAASGRINVRRTSNDWGERNITYRNAPAGTHLVASLQPRRVKRTVHIDITRMLDGTKTSLSFVLLSGGGRTLLASRQSTGHGPKIKVHGQDPGSTPSPTGTPTPSTTPSPTPSPDGSGDVQPTFPIRAAFYYPWFPETWGSSSSPFTNYHPSAGLYDSSNAATVSAHVAAMQYGGIQAGISSWWGQGSKTDQRLSTLLRAADGTTFRWSTYYENESLGDPSVSQIQSDLTYLASSYGNDPSTLRIGGRFVVFVYADGADGCGMASRWQDANTVNAYIVLKVFSGYKTCAAQPDGWHQYGPASATSDMSPDSYTISPGFWKKGETPRLTRDTARWQQQVAAMTGSGARFQLITTFNEWGEGTAVESATEWASASGYGTYLDILHGSSASGSPTPSPTSTSSTPTPTPTSTTPSPTPTSTSSSPPPSTGPLVVIYMENKERSTVVGSTTAPYQNALRAQGIDFTHYYGVTHPSLPNYLALANGATDGKQGTDSISAGELPQSPTLWNQLQNAGISWGVYEEDMPSACSSATTSGLYALKHNPATPFASVFKDAATCSHVLPYTKFDVHAMPKLSFIAPNLCNDEHDCPISTGDAWLKANVAPMLANGATVALTYDEGSSSAGINGTSGGGNIYMVVVGPGISPSVDAGQYNHYSLLAAIEKRFGLTRLNAAATTTPLPI